MEEEKDGDNSNVFLPTDNSNAESSPSTNKIAKDKSFHFRGSGSSMLVRPYPVQSLDNESHTPI